MKSLYKWVLGFVTVLLCVMCARGMKVEAATEVSVYYKGDKELSTQIVYDLTELDWETCYTGELTAEQIISECSEYHVKKPYSDMYVYYFLHQPIYLNNVSNGQIKIAENSGDYEINVCLKDGIWCVADVKIHSGDMSHIVYNSGSTSVLGSTYDFFEYNEQTDIDKIKSILPRNNLTYPEVYSGVYSHVDITVNGTDYTVTEPYPYYLALKSPSGNIQLMFSDGPFTACMADLYTMQFEIISDYNVVWYYWDSTEQNDFLSSRTVSTGFDSFLFKGSGDYMSNYSIPDTRNPLYYFLPEKASFELPKLTAKDLYAALPDELSKYYHIIIFRQDSPKAYDGRILFYGWNDNNASLYIHSSNSQIAVLNRKGAVSDYATAYYDESINTWVVSDDVVLGATTDGSYNVPFIYHSDLDLFVCDEWNVWNGKTAYLGDDSRPLVSFEEPEPDEDESLLESILSGFKKLFVSLFVPSNGFFAAKINEISSNFGFWISVRDTAAVFVDFLKETDFSVPPKVQIDLSSIKSKVNYGGKVYILDFSWYEPYKESVDVVLSAILWLVFIWNTYKNLPNIISGIGGGIQATAALSADDGKEDL